MRFVATLSLGLSLLAACSSDGHSTTSGTSSSAASSGSGGATSASSASSGTGGDTPSCAASDTAALASTGDDTPDGAGTPETVITIDHVGTAGTYPRVTSMNPGTFGQPCPADACMKTSESVSGPLSPFDEEITVVFRGPMEIYDIGVYQPSGADWTRVSRWDRCGSSDLVFLNNKGGGKSGIWTQCGGNSQSWATADGKDSAAGERPFSGVLDNEVEVNVLTAKPCAGADDASECGFSSGVALHGWAGAKLFAVRARMPRYTGAPGTNYTDAPAIWMLNARIVRTAQYGCNCRGVGSPGGCGELDVAEVLSDGHLTHATSTIYSYQGAVGADGASGSGHYFLRPVNTSATFVVLFDPAGRIQMLRLAPDAFDFGATIAGATVSGWGAQKGFTIALP
jgi:hypothetical protein